MDFGLVRPRVADEHAVAAREPQTPQEAAPYGMVQRPTLRLQPFPHAGSRESLHLNHAAKHFRPRGKRLVGPLQLLVGQADLEYASLLAKSVAHT